MTRELYVHLRAGGEDLAVPVEQAREVVEVGDVAPVPGAREAVLGVRNLRGRVLPVLDLAVALGLPRGRPARILVVEERNHSVGLAVDAVLDLIELPELTARENGLLTGSTLVGGDLVGVVDLDRVIALCSGPPS